MVFNSSLFYKIIVVHFPLNDVFRRTYVQGVPFIFYCTNIVLGGFTVLNHSRYCKEEIVISYCRAIILHPELTSFYSLTAVLILTFPIRHNSLNGNIVLSPRRQFGYQMTMPLDWAPHWRVSKSVRQTFTLYNVFLVNRRSVGKLYNQPSVILISSNSDITWRQRTCCITYIFILIKMRMRKKGSHSWSLFFPHISHLERCYNRNIAELNTQFRVHRRQRHMRSQPPIVCCKLFRIPCFVSQDQRSSFLQVFPIQFSLCDMGWPRPE